MSLSTATAADVLAACQTGAAEAGDALSRALDTRLTLTPGDAQAFAAASLNGPGLLIVLKVAGEAAVVAIAESTGVLPPWYASPDATGTSKLATLAQELGMLLLPESCMPDDFSAFRVTDLSVALARAVPDTDAQALRLLLAHDGGSATAWLVWPVTAPAALPDPAAAAEPPVVVAATEPASAAGRPALRVASGTLEEAIPAMPNYTRSLLKIRVPIVVTLAKSQQPLSRIVELAPGSIIPFDKSCEDTLSLEVNNREVAVGEAVKIGDKFGLRITSMTLPPERFVPLQSRR